MLNLIQKLTKLLNTEVTQFRQTVIFQRFLYTKTLKMLSVYYRKALRLIYQDIASSVSIRFNYASTSPPLDFMLFSFHYTSKG